MSAAEKLRELDAAIHLDMPLVAVRAGDELVRWCSPVEADALSAVRRVLPQIVAVVEAAEIMVESQPSAFTDTRITRALAALDRALGDD